MDFKVKIEYTPLIPDGMHTISIFQLDAYFLEPFQNQERRKYLISRLQEFFQAFLTLKITAEVWIDGSFATKKEEPEDVDIVFFLSRNDVDQLDTNKKVYLRSLSDKEKIKIRYSCDVSWRDIENKEDREERKLVFGTDRSGLNSKGIFVIHLKPY